MQLLADALHPTTSILPPPPPPPSAPGTWCVFSEGTHGWPESIMESECCFACASARPKIASCSACASALFKLLCASPVRQCAAQAWSKFLRASSLTLSKFCACSAGHNTETFRRDSNCRSGLSKVYFAEYFTSLKLRFASRSLPKVHFVLESCDVGFPQQLIRKVNPVFP